MGKLFFDVFPTLKTDEERKLLFQETEVEKVTTNSARSYLKVDMKQPTSHSEKRYLSDGTSD